VGQAARDGDPVRPIYRRPTPKLIPREVEMLGSVRGWRFERGLDKDFMEKVGVARDAT